MLSQEHMTSLFENATEGILLTNTRGQILLANPAACQIFGYKKNELEGSEIEMLLPEKIREKHMGLRNSFYKKPENRDMGVGRDLYACRKNGSVFPVEISLSHYKKDYETYVIAFVIDITRRKEIEANLVNKQHELEQVTSQIRKLNTELEHKVDERTHILKEALQKLEQSQSELKESLDKERQLNEIKSRFVSMASHEFRTPLSAVLSSAGLISKYTKEEEQDKRDKHIERIKESVKHLNDILEDFLSLGRLNEGRIEAEPFDFNLKETIEEIITDMKLLLKEGQFFNFRYSGIEMIYADKKLLKNILINLISNAIKFSKEKQEVTIDTDVSDQETNIKITDRGIGIAPEDQQHLFSSFFRGANAGNIQGTGLGLHIVKRYIDLMGGSANIKSEQGKGTTVSISFPSNKN